MVAGVRGVSGLDDQEVSPGKVTPTRRLSRET